MRIIKIKRHVGSLLACCLVSLLGASLLAPQTGPSTGHGGRLPSVEEQLRRHGIDLTEPALIEALGNRDAEVRWLAAQRLADIGATDAIASIQDALSRESQPISKVNIAYALAQLGDAEGMTMLGRTCNSVATAAWLRMRAARDLLDRGIETCQGSVLELLTDSDDEGKMQALSLLPLLRHLDKQQREKMLHLVRICLLSQTPAVRLAAGQALAQLGDTAAIMDLQRAIADEPEEAVRSRLQYNLGTLQHLQKSASQP